MEILNKKQTINCAGKLLELDKPVVMGILNITPDSFYDGGKRSDIEQIKQHIQQMLVDGAKIIDVGAYSSRPGATHINSREELERLRPVLQLLQKDFPDAIVSVDTFRAEIAKTIVEEYGVAIINDISGGEMDDKMFETIAQLNTPYILMHMQGTPQNMQQNPEYQNVVMDVMDYFSKKVSALKALGVHDVILDPGFGFGKTIEHNYQILNNMHEFDIFGLPILAGLSRKSMIYRPLEITPEKALNGTSVLNTLALMHGASILRVHDVKEASEAVELYIMTANSSL